MRNTMPFQVGVNLGGWLSQYPAFTREHFDSFITGRDIEQIAGWGMDHVRLPVDYPVLESDDQPFLYRSEGWDYIDRAIEWCRLHGLRILLDLHKAPGFSFDQAASSSLFNDTVKQDRFIALWQAIAQRYDGIGDNLAFELLNEIVLPGSEPWNRLARRALAAIRTIDTDRLIVVGGNRFNSASTLKELDLPDDPYLVYTFHFYEPLPFTHQKAYWLPVLVEYDRTVEYPGELLDAPEFLRNHPEHWEFASVLPDFRVDRTTVLRALQPALDFMERTGRPLYCGEYGVIDRAPVPSSLCWHRDFVEILREHGIGRAVWSYKQMDFGLVDGAGRVVNRDLVEIVSAR